MPDAADSLSMLLMLQGHRTQVAYSAKEALTCVEVFSRMSPGFDDHLVKPVDLAKLERALAGISAASASSAGDNSGEE